MAGRAQVALAECAGPDESGRRPDRHWAVDDGGGGVSRRSWSNTPSRRSHGRRAVDGGGGLRSNCGPTRPTFGGTGAGPSTTRALAAVVVRPGDTRGNGGSSRRILVVELKRLALS